MKADLAMAIHFHQPVGNFDHVMERASDKCYIPFLKTLKKYPDIKMSFHFSGCLLEWVEAHRPEMLEEVRALVKSGQVEIMTGGFYEPILPSIPERDRIGQIAMLSDHVKKEFSYKPSGAWIAERVWEPSLPSTLNEAGVKYAILDDTHFYYAGIKKDDMYGYYITEDNGRQVAVFPSDKVLRYNIPFKMPWECTEYMRDVMARKGNPLFIYGDDGEKFGEWPGTHKWVFEEKWLEKFFDEIVGNSEWLRTVTFSECLTARKPQGKVYIPTASYEEMLEWSLPADAQEWFEDVLKEVKDSGKEEYYKPFLRGGFWRNFFTKYPESDRMNKKMLYLSGALAKAKKKKGIDKDLLEDAEKEIFRGQCNCAYWHGVFGGLYLFHLRRAIYHHLIKGEALLDKALHGGKEYCASEVIDLDADGRDEVFLRNREISACFDPARGGALKELSVKNICHNLMNTLSRKKEAYHRKIRERVENLVAAGEEGCQTIHEGMLKMDKGVEDNLVYDRNPRWSFIDHFTDPAADIVSFIDSSYNEMGDFAGRDYDFILKESAKGAHLVMARDGNVEGIPVSVTKTVEFPKKGASFTVKYTIENTGEAALKTVFAPEMNFAMPDADSDRYSFRTSKGKKKYSLSSSIEEYDVTGVGIADSKAEASLKIRFSKSCRLFSFPVNTVSQSETAYELNYQASGIIPLFPLELKAGENVEILISLKVV